MTHSLIKLFAVVLLAIPFAGCSIIKENLKVVWGSSTKALADARSSSALKKTFACSYEECFTAVLAIADQENPIQEDEIKMKGMGKKEEPDKTGLNSAKIDEPIKSRKNYDIFIKDFKQRHIIVMGVPGAVDTTEVGIFFVPQPDQTTIEITSLSTSAKVKVSDIVFAALVKDFKEIP